MFIALGAVLYELLAGLRRSLLVVLREGFTAGMERIQKENAPWTHSQRYRIHR